MVWFENANFTTVELYYSRRSIVNVSQNANFGQLCKKFEGPSAWQAWICTLCNGTVVRSEVRLCRNKHLENKLVQTRTRQTLSCGDSNLHITSLDRKTAAGKKWDENRKQLLRSHSGPIDSEVPPHNKLLCDRLPSSTPTATTGGSTD